MSNIAEKGKVTGAGAPVSSRETEVVSCRVSE